MQTSEGFPSAQAWSTALATGLQGQILSMEISHTGISLSVSLFLFLCMQEFVSFWGTTKCLARYLGKT